MVSKITIFEPHLDGVQIGPASLSDEHADKGSDATSEQSGGRSRRGILVAASILAGVAVLGAILVRRRRSTDGRADDADAVDVAFEEDSAIETPEQ